MIVYGDPQHLVSANALVSALRSRLSRTTSDSLEALRPLLIQAGQLEQALADLWKTPDELEQHLLLQATQATDCAAAAFCSAWLDAVDEPGERANIGSSLQSMSCALDGIQVSDRLSVTVKTPEGFQFYALFPDQYCAAALKWLRARKNVQREILVVGIRSIGTTLSAVLRATLNAAGQNAVRFTVRPWSDPFARRVELPQVNWSRFQHALIVDEGPGISGSSMAATARALAEVGVSDICFFPGHAGEPGPAASTEIRTCWENTPRYVSQLKELKWDGRSLGESLAAKSQEFSKTLESFDVVKDCSGGEWRRFTFARETDWPAVAAQFERMKFRCTSRSGASILWKFAGLGCVSNEAAHSDFQKVSLLAEKGFTVAPLGEWRGFLAFPWIEGTRLTRTDSVSASVLERIGNYLIQAAAPALSSEEARTARLRLAEMLYWNTKESLGEFAAEQTRNCIEAAESTEARFASGDGHLAPHELVRTRSGEILKTDAGGHESDHTIVGKQPLLWDIAGALVEWDLDYDEAAPLLAPIRRAGQRIDDDGALGFYCMAYAAFRMGLMSLSLSQTSDSTEKYRMQKALNYYQHKLAGSLRKETSDRRSSRRQEADF